MLSVLSYLLLLSLAFGNHLILELSITCPETETGKAGIKLVADVPANGSAQCLNGDQLLTTKNEVIFRLAGTFNHTATAPNECLFRTKEKDSNTVYYTDIIVGHGEATSFVIRNIGLKTVECEFYPNKTVVSKTGKVSPWTPIHVEEGSHVFGSMTTDTMDVVDLPIGSITYGDYPGGGFVFHDDILGSDPFLSLGAESALEESDEPPIIELIPECAETIAGIPKLVLRADVPAYALALCKNGDKMLTSTDRVHSSVSGSFSKDYSGDFCLFHKKKGSNTFTVEVEVGWGQKGSEVIDRTDITTVTCAYDEHGKALSKDRKLTSWYISPLVDQSLLGKLSPTARFDLTIVDVLGRDVTSGRISIGKKIRLKAVDASDTVAGFRVLSCDAKNSVTSFPIIRAGCGDGRVFPKNAGFSTEGKEVYSPYFDAFKLRGGRSLQFNCTVTICESECNGSSCLNENGHNFILP